MQRRPHRGQQRDSVRLFPPRAARPPAAPLCRKGGTAEAGSPVRLKRARRGEHSRAAGAPRRGKHRPRCGTGPAVSIVQANACVPRTH